MPVIVRATPIPILPRQPLCRRFVVQQRRPDESSPSATSPIAAAGLAWWALAIRPCGRASTLAVVEARIPLFGQKIPCSGRKNSLFRAEQGILRNTLIMHCEKAAPALKTAANPSRIQKFPVHFPVIWESSFRAALERSGSHQPR